MTRARLTDEEWEFVEPFLPIGRFGPYPERLREQFEGVIWRFRTGGRWREMPERFGPWQTVYNRFRRWRDGGVFQALLETRARRDVAGARVGAETLTAIEEAAARKKERMRDGENTRDARFPTTP
ncbi:Transposase [Streptoalloteichus hindustanus]|uniref:Transposase n=1 Tax=Streptoalloteichus hindustanus TaxID=2017 RepID=A0A1M5D9E2_STRHI|nr:Transposase [Streptoalloteichus hindustanus]